MPGSSPWTSADRRAAGHAAPRFTLERWFARFEFSVRFNIRASDVEGMPLAELLALADPQSRALLDGLGLGYTEPAGASSRPA